MRKLLLCLGFTMFLSHASLAQVGINTQSPRSSLDVNGNIQLRNELRVNNDPGTAGQVYFSQGGDGTINDWKNVNVSFLEEGQFQLVNTFAKRDQIGVDFPTSANSTVTALNETFETNSTTYGAWTQFVEVPATNPNPSSWVRVSNGAGTGTPTAPQGGTQNMRFPNTRVTTIDAPITKFISPSMDLSTAISAQVTFWHAQSQNNSRQNALRVYYRRSSTSAWNLIATYDAAVAGWTQQTVTLPYPSATYQIAFEGVNRNGNPNVLDNVVVTYTTNTGYNPALSSLGESISAKNWTRIAGLDLPVTINNGQNKLSFTFQTGVESRLDPANNTSLQSSGFIRYMCGLFRRQSSQPANTAILVAVRSNQIDNYTQKTNEAKSQSIFTLNYVVENIPAGSYVFSTACRRLTVSPVNATTSGALFSVGNAVDTGTNTTSNSMMNSVVKMDVMELVNYSPN